MFQNIFWASQVTGTIIGLPWLACLEEQKWTGRLVAAEIKCDLGKEMDHIHTEIVQVCYRYMKA
jgi:hypothetical protein